MQQQTNSTSICTFCFSLAMLLCSVSYGQTNENIQLLRQKILWADSVLLISHELTEGYGTEPEKEPRDTSSLTEPAGKEFFINGKLNRGVINEQVILTNSAKLMLTKILLRQVIIRKYTPTTCDEPRHSIIIYKNDHQSYIDICFGCRRIHVSDDINFFEYNMDEKKWEQLMNFFKSNGVTRGLKDMEL